MRESGLPEGRSFVTHKIADPGRSCPEDPGRPEGSYVVHTIDVSGPRPWSESGAALTDNGERATDYPYVTGLCGLTMKSPSLILDTTTIPLSKKGHAVHAPPPNPGGFSP